MILKCQCGWESTDPRYGLIWHRGHGCSLPPERKRLDIVTDEDLGIETPPPPPPPEKPPPIPDGYHWFVAERASCPSVGQCIRGIWYLVNERGPHTLHEINMRGWQYAGPVEPFK